VIITKREVRGKILKGFSFEKLSQLETKAQIFKSEKILLIYSLPEVFKASKLT
jgi:hypothetical protein